MKLKNKAKPSIPQMDPGTYTGLCVGIYGIGEQETKFKEKTRYVEQIVFTFEFSGETVEIDGEEKPRQLSRTFTASVSERGSLRKFLKSWRGKDFTSDEDMGEFEIFNMLGQSAFFNIIHNDNGYANIDSVMPLPKGMPDPTTSTPLMSFDVDDWDDHTPFDDLPEWIQEKIQNSTQYKSDHAPETNVDFPAGSEPETAPAAGRRAPF